MTNPYSAVIITLNEERNIEQCIRALSAITSDIVVVDAESKDKTVEIARSLGVSVFILPWKGFGPAKNFGIEKCKNDWIISVDADEFVSEELKESLTLQNLNKNEVYAINILPNYCGQWIRYGTWHPDWNVRVFHRKDVRWNNNAVHEKLTGLKTKKVIRIPGMLYHYSYRSFEEHFSRMDYYARLAVQEMHERNQKPNVIKIWLGPVFRFLKSYILRLGFMDGYYGFVIAKNETLLVIKRNKYFRDGTK